MFNNIILNSRYSLLQFKNPVSAFLKSWLCLRCWQSAEFTGLFSWVKLLRLNFAYFKFNSHRRLDQHLPMFLKVSLTALLLPKKIGHHCSLIGLFLFLVLWMPTTDAGTLCFWPSHRLIIVDKWISISLSSSSHYVLVPVKSEVRREYLYFLLYVLVYLTLRLFLCLCDSWAFQPGCVLSGCSHFVIFLCVVVCV